MGIPVVEAADSRADLNGYLCPMLLQRRAQPLIPQVQETAPNRERADREQERHRNPFRPLPAIPLYEDIDRAFSWTRNTRQRGEVLHTEAPEANDDVNAEGIESPGAQLTSDPANPRRLAEFKFYMPHKYKLRFGYDPRVFLEDPRMRGQQLSEEAEKWAASYRTQIPMVTDPQMARRLDSTAPARLHAEAQARANAQLIRAPRLARDRRRNPHDRARIPGDLERQLLGRDPIERDPIERDPTGGRPYQDMYMSGSEWDNDDDEEEEEQDPTPAGQDRERQSWENQPWLPEHPVAPTAAQPRLQEPPLPHLSNVLLNGVSPNDYTARVEDSLAVLGQALRANHNARARAQAANGERPPVDPERAARMARRMNRSHVTVSPAILDRVNDLNQDLGRILRQDNIRANPRRLTRINNYLQRQAGGSPSNADHA